MDVCTRYGWRGTADRQTYIQMRLIATLRTAGDADKKRKGEREKRKGEGE